MATFQATVAPMPTGFSHLAYTNMVYTRTRPAGATMAWVNDQIYAWNTLDQLGEHDVALNALQREACGVSQGQAVTLRAAAAAELPQAFSVRVTLDLITKRKAELKEEDVAAKLLQLFAGQPVCRDGVWAMDFNGTPLRLTVTNCTGLNPGAAGGESKESKEHISKVVPAAILAAATEVDIVPNKDNKLLVLEKSESKKHTRIFDPNWRFEDMGIGGLDAEFSSIFRRAFASRLLPPKFIQDLGIKPVKGMLLYGPPGTGKTLIARQIGKMLAGREPKIVHGPEILNKFVGQAEENIRNLFADAIQDYAENKENSDLHIIIFDEIDSICKARGSVRSGTGVHDTVVNQLLTMIDGVDSPNNILVIGMTNRKDLLDPALLRPGRLEVHVEISLADEHGRRQIIDIHTKKMRESNVLADDVDLDFIAKHTKNYSGAELEGVVKAAASYAIYAAVQVSGSGVALKDDYKAMKVRMEHFHLALDEVRPAFGVAEDELKALMPQGITDYSTEHDSRFRDLRSEVDNLVNVLRDDDRKSVTTVLLKGPRGSGKTALAADFAIRSGFPFAKLIAPHQFMGMPETGKASEIGLVFDQAYKSPLSVIVIDNLEVLLDYVDIGPRFSNVVLQSLVAALARPHPEGAKRKLLIIGTTSSYRALREVGLANAFQFTVDVPALNSLEAARVLEATSTFAFPTTPKLGGSPTVCSPFPLPVSVSTSEMLDRIQIPIKQLLLVAGMAIHDNKSQPLAVQRGEPRDGFNIAAYNALRKWIEKCAVDTDAPEKLAEAIIKAPFYG